MAPEDFTNETVLYTLFFGTGYIVLDATVTLMTGTPAYFFLPWHKSYGSAATAAMVIIAVVTLGSVGFTQVW